MATFKDLSSKADKAVQLAGALKTAAATLKQALAESKAKELSQTDVDALALKLDGLNTGMADIAAILNAS